MPEITDSELRQFVRYQNLGTPEEVQKKITDLESDNRKFRQKAGKLEERVQKLPSAEALEKGEAVILTGDDVKTYEVFKSLGKPDEVKKRLEAGDQAVKDLTTFRQRESAARFAKAAGLADETVDTLVAIPELSAAKFEVRKVKTKNQTGQEVEQDTPYLTLADQKEITFDEAKEKIPALKGLRTAGASSTESSSSRNFVPQGANGLSRPGNIFDRIREERKAATAPPDPAKQSAPSLEQRLGIRTP